MTEINKKLKEINAALGDCIIMLKVTSEGATILSISTKAGVMQQESPWLDVLAEEKDGKNARMSYVG